MRHVWIVGLFFVGCTNVRLEIPEEEIEEVVVDDKVTFSGSYCTSPPADVAYPVKIMFIVDGSGSQQFSDQNLQRLVAVADTINTLSAAPNTSFKLVVFNASITATPSTTAPDVFAPADEMTEALNNLAEADTVTDYQGALAVAYAEVERDMLAVFSDANRGSAELARTKYVLILISDGLPDPQCQIGLGNDLDPNFPGGVNLLCESQDFLNCLLQADGTTCDGGICEYNDTTCYEQQDADTLFGGLGTTELVAGNDYNQPYQILQKVSDIMELEERFEVGEIRLHAGLVLDPNADPAVIEVFGDPSQAAPLMQQIAELGQGQYMEFYGGDTIDFLTINFDAIKQQRVIRSFFANNIAAHRDSHGALLADSDFDGLTDLEEIENDTDPLDPDSDGDGYGDTLETRLFGYAFDPNDPCLPPYVDNLDVDPNAACDPAMPVNCRRDGAGYRDRDLDGLNDCEERQLGTDVQSVDTDRDGLTDRVDYLAGLDPLRWDTDTDFDQDGIPNGREVEWHLSPLYDQDEQTVRERYRYDRPEVGTTIDNRPCYDFAVRHVQLVSTGQGPAFDAVGYNEIWLTIAENMADNLSGTPLFRTACVRARYVPPSLKWPQDGEIVLRESDFHYRDGTDPIVRDVDHFEPALHCLYACGADGICPAGTTCDAEAGVCRE